MENFANVSCLDWDFSLAVANIAQTQTIQKCEPCIQGKQVIGFILVPFVIVYLIPMELWCWYLICHDLYIKEVITDLS